MFVSHFEKIIYQHTTGTQKFFFAVDVAKKNIKIFQLFLKAENKENKKFFFESKTKNERQYDQITKKTNFRYLQAFLA